MAKVTGGEIDLSQQDRCLIDLMLVGGMLIHSMELALKESVSPHYINQVLIDYGVELHEYARSYSIDLAYIDADRYIFLEFIKESLLTLTCAQVVNDYEFPYNETLILSFVFQDGALDFGGGFQIKGSDYQLVRIKGVTDLDEHTVGFVNNSLGVLNPLLLELNEDLQLV